MTQPVTPSIEEIFASLPPKERAEIDKSMAESFMTKLLQPSRSTSLLSADTFTQADALRAIKQLEELNRKPDADGYYAFEVHPNSPAARLAGTPEGDALGISTRNHPMITTDAETITFRNDATGEEVTVANTPEARALAERKRLPRAQRRAQERVAKRLLKKTRKALGCRS